jgi:predicted nucleotidyltransferase component of viral defense system
VADDRVAVWLTLFQHALEILDSAPIPEQRFKHWSFGGGTVLMRSYHHRFSKDIDIFVPDPQYLGYLTPRLNDVAEAKTSDYVEQAGFVKLVFAEGEIDFVVANPLTLDPYRVEEILGRPVQVETTAEIVAKKLKYRAAEFKGRDIFDVALVLERDPQVLGDISAIVVDAKAALVRRLERNDAQLREDFAAIDTLGYTPTYDDCVARLTHFLDSGLTDRRSP